jgi:Na+/H+-translocating membrane pyrophosphatase
VLKMTTNSTTYPLQTRFLERSGGRIAYDVTGEGPLVVCAPGMGDVRAVYRFLAPALVAAGFLTQGILRAPGGNERMTSIADAVKQGAMAYMNRQYKTIFVVALIITALFALVAYLQEGAEATLWWWTTIGFATGALFSAISGYIGMNIAVRSNVRVAEAAKESLGGALGIAFNGGAVAGLAVAGLALFGVAGFFFLFALPTGFSCL